jgi:hypothetical protein
MAFFRGRVQLHSTVSYESGMAQANLTNGGESSVGGQKFFAGSPLFGNDATAPLGQQAAYAALYAQRASAYGLVQIVNALRWQELSLNYVAPASLARWAHVRQLTLALQGSNLGLHTNYRGKDLNVNAYSSGDLLSDAGQLPQPRTVQVKFILGN